MNRSNLKRFIFNKFNIEETISFFNQLSVLLSAKIDIVESLNIIKGKAYSKLYNNILSNIEINIESGKTFSESLTTLNIFPENIIYRIKAGEINGDLASECKKISNYLIKQNKNGNKIKNSITYPVILLITTITIVSFLMINVMPTFIDIYSENNAEFPLYTKILIKVSQNFFTFLYIIILIAVSLIFIYFIMSKSIKLKILRDKIIYKGFFNKLKLYIFIVNISDMIYTLSMSGINFIDVMTVIKYNTKNEFLKSLIEQIIFDLNRGDDIYTAFEKRKIFPGIFLNMLKVGIKSGELSMVMNQSYIYYSDLIENKLEKFNKKLEPFLIIFLSIIVGFIVISVIIPMFDIINTIDL